MAPWMPPSLAWAVLYFQYREQAWPRWRGASRSQKESKSKLSQQTTHGEQSPIPTWNWQGLLLKKPWSHQFTTVRNEPSLLAATTLQRCHGGREAVPQQQARRRTYYAKQVSNSATVVSKVCCSMSLARLTPLLTSVPVVSISLTRSCCSSSTTSFHTTKHGSYDPCRPQ